MGPQSNRGAIQFPTHQSTNPPPHHHIGGFFPFFSFASAAASFFSDAALSCVTFPTISPVTASTCTSSMPDLPATLMSYEYRSFPPSRSSSTAAILPFGTLASAVTAAAASLTLASLVNEPGRSFLEPSLLAAALCPF